MNYEKIYNAIINKRKRCPPDGYIERHHVLPKCVGGADDDENMVALTAREHFICHWLLVKMYRGSDRMRLASAFNAMCRVGNGQMRSSKNFDRARRLFAENHPCKDRAVRTKISGSVKRYYVNLGTESRNYVSRDCPACGAQFNVWPSDPQIYCGVACRRANIGQETKDKTSESLRKYLAGLSPDERKKRMAAALSVDKGAAISASKKGRKTRQKEIEIERYGKMSDREFEEHVAGRNPTVVSRMTNRRNMYKDGLNE